MNYKTKWRQTLILKSRCHPSISGASEASHSQTDQGKEVAQQSNITEQTNVLVLLCGGGTMDY